MSEPSDPTSPSRYRLLGTVVWLTVLFALKMVLTVGLVGFVPPAKRAADEHGVYLPEGVQPVVAVSDVYAENWETLVPLILLLVTAGVVLGRHVFRSPWPGTVFAAVCLLVLAGAILLTTNAVQAAYQKVEEGMTR